MERNRRYPFTMQYNTLLARYKGSEGKLLSNGFEWFLTVQPTPISDTYRLKITYQQGYQPNVFVVSPSPLHKPEGASILPHTYNTKKQHICIYNKNWHEWNPTMLMANTVVHWAILWLCFYENWAYTGKWEGGGHGDWDVIPNFKGQKEPEV